MVVDDSRIDLFADVDNDDPGIRSRSPGFFVDFPGKGTRGGPIPVDHEQFTGSD